MLSVCIVKQCIGFADTVNHVLRDIPVHCRLVVWNLCVLSPINVYHARTLFM